MDSTRWFLYILTLCVVISSLEAQKNQSVVIRLREELYALKVGKRGLELNTIEPIDVYFASELIKIFKVDAKSQTVQFSARRILKWRDDRQTWNPEVEGASSYTAHSSEMWVPDITLFNQHAKAQVLTEGMAIRDYLGNVGLKTEVIEEASCALDITAFPHDVQTCNLEYGSFQNEPRLSIHFYNDSSQHERTLEPTENDEWEVVSTRVHGVSRIRPYWSFMEFQEDTEQDKIIFSITIQRKPGFYNFILVTPSALIAPLTLLIFLMPSNNADRNSYGAAIFPAYPVLLLIIAEVCPPGMTTIPKVGRFLITNMFLLVLAMFLSSIVVVRLYDISDKKKMPSVLEKMLHGWVGCLCCLPHRKSSIAAGEDNVESDEKQPMNQGEAKEERRSWKLLSKMLDRIFLTTFLTVELVLYVKYVSFEGLFD